VIARCFPFASAPLPASFQQRAITAVRSEVASPNASKRSRQLRKGNLKFSAVPAPFEPVTKSHTGENVG